MKESEIRELIREADKRSLEGRLERLRFLFSIESQEEFPVSALAYEYLEEASLCWYVGAFVATIVMAQLSFEELFRAHYRVAKGVGGEVNYGKKVDRANFFDLIEAAKNDRWISVEEANLLHNLRANIRNPYVHVKDIRITEDGKQDLSKLDFCTQLSKIKASVLTGDSVKAEAKVAIQLLSTLLPEISRRSGGS